MSSEVAVRALMALFAVQSMADVSITHGNVDPTNSSIPLPMFATASLVWSGTSTAPVLLAVGPMKLGMDSIACVSQELLVMESVSSVPRGHWRTASVQDASVSPPTKSFHWRPSPAQNAVPTQRPTPQRPPACARLGLLLT
jgi:hypothetical protein